MLSQATTLFALFASLTTAHMLLNTPVPYGKSSLTNAPLNNAYPGTPASDFPCKLRGPDTYSISAMNTIPVGVAQTLSFTGGATHGGGSCQISLSVDREPTVNSAWKVIHSIIGGCPDSSTGNLSGDPKGANAATFNYTIPAGVPNGEYALAWTWLNNIGNREFYMNCAPVTVTGSAAKEGDMTVLNALPDMFVANLPREQCSTQEGVDFDFPQPGESVETVVAKKLGTSLIGSGCATMTGLGAGLAAVQGGGARTMGSSKELATATPPAPPATGGVRYPPNGTAETSTVLLTRTVSSAPGTLPTTAAPAPTSAPSSNPSPSAPPAAAAGKAPCPSGSSDGAVVCSGTSQFGICGHGYVIYRAVADGTICTDGKVLKKRGMLRHPHGMNHHHHRFGGIR